MASGPITSWQIDGEIMETVRGFIFLGSKVTADGDCSHKIKRHLPLGRNAMINLDTILKRRDITLPIIVHLVKAMVFPVVMYGCESWTVKKAECRRTDAFELLRVPWTARRSNQSILKETSPRCSLEGLMLKLKLQYFSHLILCRPLLLQPPVPPSIRVFSNESILLMRWPKYWSFSVSISPSSEYSGLIFFRMDWLDLLTVQHHSLKA